MAKYTKHCEDCGVKTMSFSPGEYGWVDGLCDDCSTARKLAKELTHPDQELTLDELEKDMSTHIEMAGYADEEIDADGLDDDRVQDIVDRAFEIARANTN